jgi:alkyl hydroperoxide reductase subunit AhpF
MYDLIIIGGGPAGVAAGVYAARKKIKTLLITDSFGGQSAVSADIQNWIGTKSISGFELAKALEEHLRAQEGIEIIEEDLAAAVVKNAANFLVKTKNNRSFEARYLLITSGSRRKKLGVPGERELEGKGVGYCATCDAPVFKNKAVAVIGGGNAGLEAVIDLLPYAAKIYLLEYAEALRGDYLSREKIKNNPKVEIVTMAEPKKILGEEFVTGLIYQARKSGELKELKLEGIFVEIGAVPNSDFVKELVELNNRGEIVVDPKTQRTSCPGIWAAGDVTDVLYKQNNISVGDAIKAALNIEETLYKK